MYFKDIDYKAKTYRELIAVVLQRRLDETNMTQASLASNLGFKSKKGNIICMHLNPANTVSAFPIARLPALKKECGLDWYECFVLLQKRATCDGTQGSTKMDKLTTDFILCCGRQAPADYLANGYGDGELPHGC